MTTAFTSPAKQTIPSEIQAQIDDCIANLNANQDLSQMFQAHFMTWKRNKIVAPWSVEMRMEASYNEGIAIGVRSAVTAIMLASIAVENKTDEDEEILPSEPENQL